MAQLGIVHASTATLDVTGAPQPGHVTDSGSDVQKAGNARPAPAGGGGPAWTEGAGICLPWSITARVGGYVGSGDRWCTKKYRSLRWGVGGGG